jgi:hypothetical protein
MKKFFAELLDFFGDAEHPDEPGYDPAHLAAMIVAVLFSLNVLFWLLWALLVFGGGIQAKIVPFFQIALTAKTAAEFGYVGYPYAMGIFEGWITNVAALFFLAAVVAALRYIFYARVRQGIHEDNLQQ